MNSSLFLYGQIRDGIPGSSVCSSRVGADRDHSGEHPVDLAAVSFRLDQFLVALLWDKSVL